MQTPAPFTYERATSVDAAIAALVEYDGEARIIAGGHSLLPMMKLRLAQPQHLIDINDLADLAYIREFADEIATAIRRVNTLAELARERFRNPDWNGKR